MVIRPRALDLFCGAGGASMGLHRAEHLGRQLLAHLDTERAA